MNITSIEAFPLSWPPERPRTKLWSRKRAPFCRRAGGRDVGLSIGDSRDRLLRELRLLGASAIVISSNLRLRNDGLPLSFQREPDDTGIAVYFTLVRAPHCLSCDAWDRTADNLAAIAKHVEASRGQLRWGVTDIAHMFAGFKSLPGAGLAPETMTPLEAAEFIAAVAGDSPVNAMGASTFRDVYQRAAKKLHPDAGGDDLQWQRLQRAADIMKLTLKM